MMTPELADLLTRLHSVEFRSKAMPQRKDQAAAYFYAYLDDLGIEHCNFGGFTLTDKLGDADEFSFTRLTPAFQEEFVAELVAHDYPVLKAQELSPAAPTMILDVGCSNIDEIRAYHAPAEKVVDAVSGQGLVDAVALIGILNEGQVNNARYFGFIFGGERGTSELIRSQMHELHIASMALLDATRPHVDGILDGFTFNLSAREREILVGVSLGKHRKELAFSQNISVPTVDFHLSRVRRKLGASTNAEAVSKAYRYGVIS